jgi:hypothetical protein
MKSILLNIIFASILVAACVFQSCKNDFELNAPYEAIPVVYGFIDPSVDTQFVKINKTFVGDGNNSLYAGIRDSVEFENVSGTVDEYDENGDLTNSWDLEEISVGGIEDGIFYEDFQTLYYFVPAAGIDFDATYKLNININEGEKLVSAETEVIKGFNFSSVFKGQLVGGANFAFSNSSGDNAYPSFEVSWTTAEGGRRFEPSLVFIYDEYTAGDTTKKTITWNLGSQTTSDADGGKQLDVKIQGDAFYQFLEGNLANNPIEAAVTKRVLDRLEFYVTVADEDLNTYIEISQPSLGIITERPTFTNITGGIGLFASRYTDGHISTGVKKLTLNAASSKELCIGQFTGAYKFCTDSLGLSTHPTSPSPYCP